MYQAHHAEVGVLEQALHDPHDVRQNVRLRIEARHHQRHIGRALVVGDDQRARVLAPAGGQIVAALHHTVAGRVRPHGHQRQQPVEEQALDAIVQVRLVALHRQQQRHPDDVRGQAVDVVQDDERGAQQRLRVHDEVAGPVAMRAGGRLRIDQQNRQQRKPSSHSALVCLCIVFLADRFVSRELFAHPAARCS